MDVVALALPADTACMQTQTVNKRGKGARHTLGYAGSSYTTIAREGRHERRRAAATSARAGFGICGATCCARATTWADVCDGLPREGVRLQSLHASADCQHSQAPNRRERRAGRCFRVECAHQCPPRKIRTTDRSQDTERTRLIGRLASAPSSRKGCKGAEQCTYGASCASIAFRAVASFRFCERRVFSVRRTRRALSCWARSGMGPPNRYWGSAIGHLLRRGGWLRQLGPDLEPIVRAQVAPSDSSFRCALDRNAPLNRHRAITICPL